MRSCQSGCAAATRSHARISRSKPFWDSSRPAATTILASSGAMPPPMRGTAFGIRTIRTARRRAPRA